MKKKITLGVIAALTTATVPVATVISCGKKEAEPKKVSDKITVSINMDHVLKNAKSKSTDQNIKNNLVKSGSLDSMGKKTLDKNGQLDFFDEKSNKYVDPLYFVIVGTLENIMQLISEDAPAMTPILEKLKKNNSFYNITKDIMKGVLETKLLGMKNTYNKKAVTTLLKMGMASAVIIPSLTNDPTQLILDVLDSVWKETKTDLEKTGITVGEIGALLRQFNGKKISIAMTIDGKKYDISKETTFKLPIEYSGMILALFPENDKSLLSDKIESLKPIIHKTLPAILKLPKKSIGTLSESLLTRIIGGASASKSSKINENDVSVQQDPNRNPLEIILKSIQRIANKTTTKMDVSEKLTDADMTWIIKTFSIPKEVEQFIKPIILIFTKVAELYQS